MTKKRGGKYFQAEDLVWLHMPYVLKGQSLAGPFPYCESVVRSKPHTGKKQRFVVHFDHLKPYK